MTIPYYDKQTKAYVAKGTKPKDPLAYTPNKTYYKQEYQSKLGDQVYSFMLMVEHIQDKFNQAFIDLTLDSTNN